MTATEPPTFVLETRGLTRYFSGFVAVDNVNLRIRAGTIHAIIGPNGAGKTTCFNLLTKSIAPTRGTILYDGQDITKTGPAAVARGGLVRSFQISSLFPHLTLLANVRVALQRAVGNVYNFWSSARVLDALDSKATELLAEVGLADLADTVANGLPYGRKRALEIATTLALEPRVLLLDEPTQGMGHEDVDRIIGIIRRVAQGRTVVMVEHNMTVVEGLCDTITVMARGQVLAEGNYPQVSANPLVIEAYLGTDADA